MNEYRPNDDEVELGRGGDLELPRWVAVTLTLLAGIWIAVFPFLLTTMGLQGDFLAFYTSGHVVWWGELARLYDRELFRTAQIAWVGVFEGAYRFVYLPAFIGYYLPFAALPLAVARITAVLGGIGLVSVALRISRAWLTLSAGVMLLALLAFAGSYATFIVGQNSPLTLLLMALVTVWMAIRPRPLYAGLAAGLLLYKPQLLLGVGVVWLVRRAWRSLTILGVMGIGWLCLSWLLAPTATLQYLTLGQSLLGSLKGVNANGSVYAALGAWLPQEMAIIGAVGVAVAVLGSLAWVWGQYPPTRWHYGMLWLSSLLSTPYVATYDLLLLLLPLSLLVPLLPRHRGLQIVFAGVWIGPAISLVTSDSYWVAWAMMALYGVCGWNAIKSGERRKERG